MLQETGGGEGHVGCSVGDHEGHMLAHFEYFLPEHQAYPLQKCTKLSSRQKYHRQLYLPAPSSSKKEKTKMMILKTSYVDNYYAVWLKLWLHCSILFLRECFEFAYCCSYDV